MLVFRVPPQSCSQSPATGTPASRIRDITCRTLDEPPVMPSTTPPDAIQSGRGCMRPAYSVYASVASAMVRAPMICPVSAFVGVVETMETSSSSVKSNSPYEKLVRNTDRALLVT